MENPGSLKATYTCNITSTKRNYKHSRKLPTQILQTLNPEIRNPCTVKTSFRKTTLKPRKPSLQRHPPEHPTRTLSLNISPHGNPELLYKPESQSNPHQKQENIVNLTYLQIPRIPALSQISTHSASILPSIPSKEAPKSKHQNYWTESP